MLSLKKMLKKKKEKKIVHVLYSSQFTKFKEENYLHQPRLINSHIRYLSFIELFFYFSIKVIQVIYM